MHVICLDLEGVLIPEIWINFSKKTGIKELSLTTRDISDYDVLMRQRLEILKQHNLNLKDIQDVIDTMDPLEGALDFLETIRSWTQVIILSDTFEEFAKPMMKKLNWPTIFCNDLIVDSGNMIKDYRLRQYDGKRKAIEALRNIGFNTFAAGDSYNDLTMIKTADYGAFFRAPASIMTENPEVPAVFEYSEFLDVISDFLQK